MMGKKCPLYCGLVGDSHPSVSQLLHAHTAHTKVPIMKNTRLHLPSRASLIPNLENCIPSYAHHRTPVYIIRQQAPLNSIYKWVQSLNEIKFGLFFLHLNEFTKYFQSFHFHENVFMCEFKMALTPSFSGILDYSC